MKKIWAGIGLAGLLLAGLVAVVAGQGSGVGRLQPLLVDVQQAVPVEVSFVVEGAEPQTVTVPMTLDLHLQVGLSSSLTPVISVGPVGPALVRTQLESDVWYEDGLGLRYQIAQEVDWVTISEWTAYTKDDYLEIAGELRNEGEVRFSLVEFVLRLYDASDKLVSVENGTMSGRFIDPGQSGRFKFTFYIDPADVAWYRVEILTPQ